MPAVRVTLIGEIPEAELPRGPAGSGLVSSHIERRWAPSAVQQMASAPAYAPLGPWTDFQDGDARRVVISARGEIGHSEGGAITYLTIARNGTPIHRQGNAGLATVRSKTRDSTEPFSIQFTDVLPIEMVGQLVRYELFWRTLSGTVFMGRRPDDAMMNTDCVVTLSGLIA